MRYLRYVALLAVFVVPLAYSQAQVSVGVGIGVGPGYVAGPPACAYGYYDYYPYACAPYGYYGPNWFVDGIFIGAGPWYHWGRPAWFWNRGYVARGWATRGTGVAATRTLDGATAMKDMLAATRVRVMVERTRAEATTLDLDSVAEKDSMVEAASKAEAVTMAVEDSMVAEVSTVGDAAKR